MTRQSLVAEQAALAVRIQKLTLFIGGAKWSHVLRAERRRLRRQLALMEQLDAVLLERIAAA